MSIQNIPEIYHVNARLFTFRPSRFVATRWYSVINLVRPLFSDKSLAFKAAYKRSEVKDRILTLFMAQKKLEVLCFEDLTSQSQSSNSSLLMNPLPKQVWAELQHICKVKKVSQTGGNGNGSYGGVARPCFSATMLYVVLSQTV